MGIHKAPLDRGFVNPYREGLSKASIGKGLCTHMPTHICTFQSFFLQIPGVFYYGGLMKLLYRRGFAEKAL